MSNGSHTRVEWGRPPRGGWDDPSRLRSMVEAIPNASEEDVVAAVSFLRRQGAVDVAEMLGVVA